MKLYRQRILRGEVGRIHFLYTFSNKFICFRIYRLREGATWREKATVILQILLLLVIVILEAVELVVVLVELVVLEQYYYYCYYCRYIL